jgi:hypothetical protein
MTNGGAPTDPDDTTPEQSPPPLLRPYGASNVPEPFASPPPFSAPPPSPQSGLPASPGEVRPPPPPGYAGYRAARTSGLAIASMVLGIVWLFWLGSILAVIFGHVALSQIKRSMGALSGRGMAIAGLALGYVGIALLVVSITAAVIIGPTTATAAECALDRALLSTEERAYFEEEGHYTDIQGLEDAGYRAHDSDMHSVRLNGDPSNATGYTIVNEDRCD